MKKLILSLIFLLISVQVNSQTPFWRTLSNAPVADTGVLRFDDIYFINANTGWIIQGTNYYIPNDTGKVFKTTDGGQNWYLVNKKITAYLRSTGYFSETTGIIGTLDSNHILWRTTDGGYNWTDIASSIQGVVPSAICGISIVNSNVAFASGRYYCPANLIKTTNAGLNWVSIPIDTSLARSFVDCFFWSADSGFVVGGYSPNNQLNTSNSIILMTTNGGANWTRVHKSGRTGEWCWKIQFVNRQLGFSSIESIYNYPTYMVKTTNGGVNWTQTLLPNSIADLEGIGFINANTGWVGGWGFNFHGPTFQTTNGGVNWQQTSWGVNVNRFRFLSDTLAYAVGETVYKYSNEPVGIHNISTDLPEHYELYQNFPNPFNPSTKIKFDISSEVNRGNKISLKIYDVIGNEIKVLVNDNLRPGSYEVVWNASDYPSGIYFYKLSAGSFTKTNKLILIK